MAVLPAQVSDGDPVAHNVCDWSVIEPPAPNDYTSTSQLLTFSATNTREDVAISITDDNIDEVIEQFLGHLTLVTSGVNVQLSPQQTEVQIIDDDGNIFFMSSAMPEEKHVCIFLFWRVHPYILSLYVHTYVCVFVIHILCLTVPTLPFLRLDTTPGVAQELVPEENDEGVSGAISPPGGFRIFNETYSNFYVCKTKCSLVTSLHLRVQD